jgi:hypothetical protein
MAEINRNTGMRALTDLSIYDILRELVMNAQWRDEAAQVRLIAAIKTAEDNQLFRTEGQMQL